MTRHVLHRVLERPRGREEIRPRKSVHVAAHGNAHVVQDRGHQVGHRAARILAGRHGRSVGEQETVGARLVRAGELAPAEQPIEEALADGRRLHAEAGHHQQQVVRPERLQGAADFPIEIRVVTIEHRANSGGPARIAEQLGLRLPQVDVTERLETFVADRAELRGELLVERGSRVAVRTIPSRAIDIGRRQFALRERDDDFVPRTFVPAIERLARHVDRRRGIAGASVGQPHG